MEILITGVGGFIGSALAKKFINKGFNVVGIDNLNSYYDVNLKLDRLKDIESSTSTTNKNWEFIKCDLINRKEISLIFKKFKPKVVINLAAQAGVRFSIKNPHSYIQSNILGFSNVLDSCLEIGVENFIYASSSSVYGGNTKLPFKEEQSVDHPLSLYAATKKANELIAHSYSHIYKIPSIGLRFFTVYGPWGRPDMAPMIFTKSILKKEPIKIYNYGKMKRDFTYIDDIVEGIFLCSFKPATSNKNFDSLSPDPSTSFAPYRLFNIGNTKSINLLDFVEMLEKELNIKAIKNLEEIQPGDVVDTNSDTQKLEEWIDYAPSTSLEKGVKRFIDWYLNYYKN